MAQVLRVVVATSDEASRNLILRVAGQHPAARVVAEVDSDYKLMDVVAYRRPQVAFVSTELADMRGFETADRLSRKYPGLYVAMLTPRNNVEEVRRAMRAGARDCLFEPISEDAILRVIDAAQDLGQAVAERRGAITAVMSSKGGVGKSTLAVNLAIALKQLNVGRVALVDGDLHFGDVAMLLNLKPERTIYDLNAALDAEIADRFLHTHSTGVEVLAAPLRTEQAEEISPVQFRTILSVLQSLYDYLVVDVTVSSLETMLATLDVADLALVLTTLDVVCLKDVSQILDMLNRLRFPAHNVTLIGNKYDERLSLSLKDAERTLGMRLAAVVPRDDRVVLAGNRGVPMIVGEPGTPFTQRVVSIAKAITTQVGRLERVPA